MSDLNINPDAKISIVGKTLVISTKQDITVVCLQCGEIKNVFLLQPPTTKEMQPDGKLHTGVQTNSLFQRCLCTASLREGIERLEQQAMYRATMDAYRSIGGCLSVKDARRVLLSLAANLTQQ